MQNSKLDNNLILTDIDNEFFEFKKSFNKLEAGLAISKSVIEITRKQKAMLERKSWFVTGKKQIVVLKRLL